jgi:thioredoxin:protein disulfide reductase
VALALAAGSIGRLPQSGAWLQWTEHLFGCILLAMAVYFVEPVLPEPLAYLLMPIFLALSVAYLAFFDAAGRQLRVFLMGRRVAGAAVLSGLAMVYLPVGDIGHAKLPFEPFSAQAFDRARSSGAPFVIDFSADWCLPCREMAERTFSDPRVLSEARGMSFLSVDMTTTDRRTELLLESFKVVGAPTILFYGPDGKELTRKIGFVGPQEFAQLLSQTRRASSGSDVPPPGASPAGV